MPEKHDKNKYDAVCRYAVCGCILSMTTVICAAVMSKHGGDSGSVMTTVVAAGVVFAASCFAACFVAHQDD